jgi:hypothetical protein
MDYKEFLYKMSVDVLTGLEIPGFVKNIAKKKMEEYFKNPENDVDLELIFQKILENLKNVKYP